MQVLFVLLILAISFFVLLWWYFAQNVALPKNIDQQIEKLKQMPLPDLMPGNQGFVKNGEVTICYEWIKSENPNAEVVLLLHGHSQTMLAFPLHFINPFLDAGYDVIRVDHRGSGLSSWLPNWGKGNKYSLEHIAEDAFAVMNELNIHKFHLVGKSMGGMIGQRMAINKPEKILSFTSIMSTGYFNDPKLVNVPRKFLLRIVLAFIKYGFKLNTLEKKLKFHVAIEQLLVGKHKDSMDYELVLQKALYENIKRKGYNGKNGDQHSYAIKKSGSRYDELKNLQVPCLVVHGTEDTLVKFEHGKKYAELIPNAKKLFIKDMGHRLPKMYCPQISEAILKLLRENSYSKAGIAAH